jgi:hypothetical protein
VADARIEDGSDENQKREENALSHRERSKVKAQSSREAQISKRKVPTLFGFEFYVSLDL